MIGVRLSREGEIGGNLAAQFEEHPRCIDADLAKHSVLLL